MDIVKRAAQKKRFRNNQLNIELERIKDLDTPFTLERDYDDNLDTPYILSVADHAYLYHIKDDREQDFLLMIKKFGRDNIRVH